MDGQKELLEDRNPGRSHAARALEAQFARQFLEIPVQDGDGVSKAREARVAADLADDAQNTDGAELLKDIGVAEDGGFDCFRLVAGLVLLNSRKDGGNLVLGEARLAKDNGGVGAGIGDVIPAGQVVRILGAMSDKDAEIVEPGSGGDNVAVMREIGAEGLGEFDQAGLVTELIHRASLDFHELGQSIEGF
jgi:hypothetical protein